MTSRRVLGVAGATPGFAVSPRRGGSPAVVHAERENVLSLIGSPARRGDVWRRNSGAFESFNRPTVGQLVEKPGENAELRIAAN